MKLKKRTREKLISGSRGIISLLLIILLAPFLTLATILVEYGRYQTAVRALDEAIGSSSLSALSAYDSYLLERFGLLALKQDNDVSVQDLVIRYLSAQKTTDMRSVELDIITADGILPLADISILRQQVLQYSSILSPTKMVTDVLDIDYLITELEKKLGVKDGVKDLLTQVSSGADLLDSEISVFEALDNAKDACKAVSNAISPYNSAYTDWCSAVNALIIHLATERPAESVENSDDDSEDTEKYTAEDYDADTIRLQSACDTARQKYVDKINDLIGKIDTLQKKIDSAVGAQADFDSKVVSFTQNSANSIISGSIAGTEDKDLKTTADNFKSIENALGNGAKSVTNEFKECLNSYDSASLAATSSALLSLRGRVAGFSHDNPSSTPSEGLYHNVDLSGLQDPNVIDRLLDEAWEQADSGSTVDQICALVDIINSMFKLETSVDGELCTMLDVSYYNSNYGGLPSTKDRNSSEFSLAASFAGEDEQRSKQYLQMIDPDYDADDPYSLNVSSAASKLETLFQKIQNLSNSGQQLRNAKGIISFGRAVISVFTNLYDVITAAFDLVTTLIENLVKMFANRLVLYGYMAYNLPNRTTYDSGKTLGGFSYSKASLAPSPTGTNFPILGDFWGVSSNYTNYAFSGCEMEYIMWGSTSEAKNQALQFLALYVMRMLLDFVPVLADDFVSGIMDGVMAVPYVGPVLAVVVGVLFCLTEPFLDCVVLVNGGDVPLVKVDIPGTINAPIYLSPEGIPKFIGALTSLKMKEATKNDLTNSLAKATNLELPERGDDGYGEELLKIDYTQHSLLLMIAFCSERTSLNRLADLIQTEMTMRNLTTQASLSQNLTGEYTRFDIDEAYTAVRVQVTGSLRQVLPVPTLSSSSPLSVDRVIYRGY